MIIFLLIGLVLLATAVALITRGVIAARLRTADTLGQIGHYGFAGDARARSRPAASAASSTLPPRASASLLTDRLKLVNEERLRKTLVSAGMYRTSPRMLIGYQLLFGLALPAVWLWLAVGAGPRPR